MFDRIRWFLDDHFVVKLLLFSVLAVFCLAVLGAALFFLCAFIIYAIQMGWNQTIVPITGTKEIGMEQAVSIFWFIVSVCFVSGLSFGLGKRIFGGGSSK